MSRIGLREGLAGPLSTRLSGVGVHSGAPGSVLFQPRGDGDGVRLFIAGRALRAADLAALPRRAHRSTILVSGEASLRTPEHLLAAMLFFADRPLDVFCEGPEVPGLDGSALPFRAALASLFPGGHPRWREYDCDLRWETEWENGSLRVEPARNFNVTYEIDRGPLRESFRLESPAQAWEEILPARTFVFHRDWSAALAAPAGTGADLMRGAGVDSGLLLAESEEEFSAALRAHPEWAAGPFPLLNGPAWRMPAEPVKHKILDLLGDLALAGLALPRLSIRVRNGGHRWNHLLLENLPRY